MDLKLIKKKVENNKLIVAVGCCAALGGLIYYFIKDTKVFANIIEDLLSDNELPETVDNTELTREKKYNQSITSNISDRSSSFNSSDMTLARATIEKKPRLILFAANILYHFEHHADGEIVILNPRFRRIVKSLQKTYEILFLAKALNTNQQNLIEQALENNKILKNIYNTQTSTRKGDNQEKNDTVDKTFNQEFYTEPNSSNSSECGILINSENVLYYSTTEGKYNMVKHLATENPPRILYNRYDNARSSVYYDCNKITVAIDTDFEFLEEIQNIVPTLVYIKKEGALEPNDQTQDYGKINNKSKIHILTTIEDVYNII
ncbi:hypothetical protein BB561_006775 [Smittium simulii]|uniref:Uncharacterized protein n=1 Tax=Smittium simulii TaxID=133385 RepID=A0A2T9Y1N3_9FUNG|nr:hypothetical protein BB561_006775 [Smittium simulii]